MRIIGVGLPRTGTLSQKVALEMLGLGPCYHMVSVLADLAQVPLWERALAGEAPWDEIFANFTSTVDWPGGFFYRELIDAFPDAKVVLSVRDPVPWEKSMRRTVWQAYGGDGVIAHLSKARAHVDPQWAAFSDLMAALLWEGKGTFATGAKGEGDHDLVEVMQRYNDEVKATVPADRLLVWQVSEGWERLCEFVGAPVPAEPFPHVNDGDMFEARVFEGSLAALNVYWNGRAAGLSPRVS